MNENLYPWLAVAVISAVTVLLRFLPFMIFGRRQTPKPLLYLGRVLPFSVMGMLVVYCLRNISFTAAPFGAPELISVALVVVLHLLKRNTLLSIVGGTACYMMLCQLVF